MAEWSTQLQIPLDSDGFGSFNCPHCGIRFMLSSGELNEFTPDEFYCPVCGLSHVRVKFISDDALEAARIQAINLARDAVYKSIKDTFGRSSRSGSFRFKVGPPPKHESEKVLIESDDLELVMLQCCGRHVKINDIDEVVGVYCPYCGEQR